MWDVGPGYHTSPVTDGLYNLTHYISSLSQSHPGPQRPVAQKPQVSEVVQPSPEKQKQPEPASSPPSTSSDEPQAAQLTMPEPDARERLMQDFVLEHPEMAKMVADNRVIFDLLLDQAFGEHSSGPVIPQVCAT